MSATQHPSEMTTGARIVWARRLYTHLAERVGRDVSFEELEAAFCFDICSSVSNRKDMLFSKTLRFNVSKILIDVIRRIDGISIALPGLDEWERSTQSRASVMSECNSLYNNILPMFICAQCDVERLRTVALESCHAAIRSCVRRACLRIEAHMGELGDLLQFCGGWTCCATTNEWPPPLYYLANKSTVYMEETLACASVPIEELRCLLGWEGTPLCGASRELAVSRWLDLHAQSVGVCCVDVLHCLQSVLHKPDSWEGWHGVVLKHTTPQSPIPASRLPCPDTMHAPRACQLWVCSLSASASTCRSALRTVRVAHILLSLIEENELRARTVRAELLLPLVSRFICDCVLEHDRVAEVSVGSTPEVLVENRDCEWSCADQNQFSLDTALEEAVRVPLNLRRDYVIVSTLWHMATATDGGKNGYVYVACASLAAKVAALVRATGDKYLLHMASIKEASLCQAASGVMRKIASIASASPLSLEDVGDIRYGSAHPDQGQNPRSKGLTFHRRSLLKIQQLIREQLDGMLPPNSIEFAGKWHTSRFAKLRATSQIQRRGAFPLVQ